MSEPGWSMVLELAPDRSVTAGSKEALAAAIGRGADLRIYTEFLYEEHILPGGSDDRRLDGLIREVIDFRETILVDGRYVAAITTLRQPLEPPHGFNGPDPKMSFFMYTMDGDQALANLVLDGPTPSVSPGERTLVPTPADMPKMGVQEFFDVGTTGPSRNFVYDMEVYRYFVRDEWTEILAHDADGRVTAGSFAALEDAQIAGREVKVGIRDLGADLASGEAALRLPRSLHARRVRLRPRPGRAVRHAHPPARPGRRRGPAALRVGELGRRVGLPADGR